MSRAARPRLGEVFAAALVAVVGTLAATVAIGALVFAATFQSVARWVRQS